MSAFAACVLCAATVSMGIVLARGYLRGERRPVRNSVHLLLGAGSLEALAVTQQGLSDLPDPHSWSLLKVAMGLFALALVLGLTSQLLARQSTWVINRVLISHASAGAVGFVLFLIWASR
jgi:hypothetical protein